LAETADSLCPQSVAQLDNQFAAQWILPGVVEQFVEGHQRTAAVVALGIHDEQVGERRDLPAVAHLEVQLRQTETVSRTCWFGRQLHQVAILRRQMGRQRVELVFLCLDAHPLQ